MKVSQCPITMKIAKCLPSHKPYCEKEEITFCATYLPIIVMRRRRVPYNTYDMIWYGIFNSFKFVSPISSNNISTSFYADVSV